MIESDMRLHLYRRYFIAASLTLGFAGLCAAQAKGPATNTLLLIPTILVLGDSLSAEYGLARGTGWVALMEQRLAREKIAAKVINASISGDTTSGGRARLGALLAQHRPTVVVIELGANDALRGLPLQMTQNNLLVMVQAVQASGAKALLVGMQMPPNYGEDYAKRFADTYTAVARIAKVPLVPFLLKGVADVPDALRLFQSDRIHPTAAAHPTMLNNVWPAVLKLLK
jgi:acyl-CoA thioesterase I